MQVKFLIINGSERTSGNTTLASLLIEKILQDSYSNLDIIVKTIFLKDLDVVACNKCEEVEDCNYRNRICSQSDDIESIYEEMKAADCIIYATPVHGFGLPPLMQNFVERMGVGYLRFDRPLANKIGGIVAVGRRYAHEAVFSQLIQNLLLNRMIVVGSGFPVYLQGGRKGEVYNDKEGLDSLYRMVIRMCDFAIGLRKSNLLSEMKSLKDNERNYIYELE